MQNALYFENSHVRPVPLVIGVKKKILQRIITIKKYHAPLLHWEKICLAGQWEILNLSKGKTSNPPPPQKSNGLPLSFMFICHGPNHVFFTHEILDFRLIIIIIIIMMMMM